MNEYFVNTNDSYVPSYKPGFPGYGQDGANANTGDTGASVYYSSIDFSNIVSNSSLLEKIKYLIKHGKSLSNNSILSQNENDNVILYKPNDIIIDSTGTFYYLSDNLDIKQCDFNANLKSEIVKNINYFNVYCATKYYRSAYLKNKIENYNTKNVTSYKFIHNDNNDEFLYGNYIKFDLSFNASYDITNLLYKFVLILPDGRVLEHYSQAPTDTIFVENKLLFNCVDSLTGKDMSSITMQDIKTALMDNNQWSNLSIVTSEKDLTTPLKELISYNGVSNNYLSSNSVSIIMSYIIRNNCTAYVEISDKVSGEIYKLDVNDITFQNTKDDSGNVNDHIKEGTENIKWEQNLFQYPIAKYLKNDDGTLFYPFISYTMFSNESIQLSEMSENNIYANFYFMNAGGLAYHLAHNFNKSADSDIVPDQDIIKFYNLALSNETEDALKFTNNYSNKEYILADRNRTYKLNLRGIKRVSISISFTSYLSFKDNIENPLYGGNVNYPNAVVYIGCPDIPLIDYDYIPDASLNKKTGSINYYIKFIPPTYEDEVIDSNNAKIANAGVANVTIDLEEFGIVDNNLHYIEIGVSLIKNVKKLQLDKKFLNPPRLDKSSDECIINGQKISSWVEYLNGLHRPSIFSGDTESGNYYKFLSSELILNNSEVSFKTLQTINGERPSPLSGIPDVKMYISKLEEFDSYSKPDDLIKITEPRYRDVPNITTADNNI